MTNAVWPMISPMDFSPTSNHWDYPNFWQLDGTSGTWLIFDISWMLHPQPPPQSPLTCKVPWMEFCHKDDRYVFVLRLHFSTSGPFSHSQPDILPGCGSQQNEDH